MLKTKLLLLTLVFLLASLGISFAGQGIPRVKRNLGSDAEYQRQTEKVVSRMTEQRLTRLAKNAIVRKRPSLPNIGSLGSNSHGNPVIFYADYERSLVVAITGENQAEQMNFFFGDLFAPVELNSNKNGDILTGTLDGDIYILRDQDQNLLADKKETRHYAPGLVSIDGLVTDSFGNIFATPLYNTTRIFKYQADQEGKGFSIPQENVLPKILISDLITSMAFDGANNLYFSTINGDIWEMRNKKTGDSADLKLLANIPFPVAITYDDFSEKLYIVGAQHTIFSSETKVTVSGAIYGLRPIQADGSVGTMQVIDSGYTFPVSVFNGITTDNIGRIYFVDNDPDQIRSSIIWRISLDGLGNMKSRETYLGVKFSGTKVIAGLTARK